MENCSKDTIEGFEESHKKSQKQDGENKLNQNEDGRGVKKMEELFKKTIET